MRSVYLECMKHSSQDKWRIATRMFFDAAKIRCNYDKTKLFPLKVVIDMDFLAVLVVL